MIPWWTLLADKMQKEPPAQKQAWWDLLSSRVQHGKSTERAWWVILEARLQERRDKRGGNGLVWAH